MRIIRSIAVMSAWAFLSSAMLSSVTLAATSDGQPHNHKMSHSETAVTSSKNVKKDSKMVGVNKPMVHASIAQESMEKMDNQIKLMQEMHEKMMNAKTPEERKAHMVEHMETMQGGMAMMNEISEMCSAQKMDTMPMTSTNQMMSDNPVKRDSELKTCMKCDIHSHMEAKQKILEKRMEMMEAIMQMMIDRNETYDEYAVRMLKK